MRRLELGTIRICRHCGRGRAELLAEDGSVLSVRLGPHRARLLADRDGDGPAEELPWLADVVTSAATATGGRVSDVVFDHGPQGLRGLVTWVGAGDALTVAACEPEEALEIAHRASASIFATDEALRPVANEQRDGHTVH